MAPRPLAAAAGRGARPSRRSAPAPRATPRPSSSGFCLPVRSTAGSATRPSPSIRTPTGAWPASSRPSPPRTGWARPGDAEAWQTEYDDFLAAYRKAAARDTLHDASGNAYVPTMMGNIDHHVPQRGQWAFCHAVYPGGVFAPAILSWPASLPCSARRSSRRGPDLRHRLDARGHLDLFRLVLWPCRPLERTGTRGRTGPLRLRPPRQPRARSGARSRSPSARATRRSATCPTTGPAPSSSVSAPI